MAHSVISLASIQDMNQAEKASALALVKRSPLRMKLAGIQKMVSVLEVDLGLPRSFPAIAVP